MAKPNFGQMFIGGIGSLLQHNTERGLREIPGNLIMQGRLLEGLTVSTTATPIAHGLGRRPRGFFVVDRQGNTQIWRTAWDTKFITLDASASDTVSIWVF